MTLLAKIFLALLLFGLTLAFAVTTFIAGYFALRHGHDVLGVAGLYLLTSITAGALFTLLGRDITRERVAVTELSAAEVFAPLNIF